RTMTGALNASEAQVRAIVENVADGFVTYGEGGAIEIYNRAAERLFGYPPSHVVGGSLEMLVPGAIGGLTDRRRAGGAGGRAAGALMRFAGSWHAADHPPVAFLTATAGSIFTRGVDLPGCVWESGRPEWIADVTRDPRFLRGAAAAQDGLRTGVALPVVVGGE